MEFKKWETIGQFRDVVRQICSETDFCGLDNENKPIYKVKNKPTLEFEGTVKLHGTNSGICYSENEGVIVQKRNSFEDDLRGHFGFVEFVKIKNKEFFESLMKDLYKTFNLSGSQQIILYGEWAGEGIQKGVAISNIEKSFFIFGISILKNDLLEKIDPSFLKVCHERVFNIHDFKKFKIKIDFNKPDLAINLMSRYVAEVENECPVGKKLGVEGVGEGIVWKGFFNNRYIYFKTKGQKHSVSKVKKIISKDPELIKNIYEFVDYACTENRINQGIQETSSKDKSDMPKLLKWVSNDILKEESDVLETNNLKWKDVCSYVTNKTRELFFKSII